MLKLPGLKYYSLNELFLRVIWNLIGSFLFSISPRHLYKFRNLILRMFGAKIGSNTKIFPSVKILHPWLLDIGDNVVVSWNVQLYNLKKIEIGNNTIVSQNAHLCGGTHDYLSDGFELIRCDIKIGENVWIGADAFIGPNVEIGNSTIISSRAVCFQSIPMGVIAGGNPAKIIKKSEKPELKPNSVS